MTLTAVHGALNFRDLGGLPTNDGRRTAAGAIFRSDALDLLTTDGVRALCDVLRVVSVIDLRDTAETSGRSPVWAGNEAVEFVSLPIANHHYRMRGPADEPSREPLLVRTYRCYIDAAAANLVAALEVIASNGDGRPTVFHCAIGKDRTGVLAAVLLDVLDVTPDAIVADYSATARNMERLMDRLSMSAVYRRAVASYPQEAYRADGDTMREFLAWLQETEGGGAEWAVSRGLQPSSLERLRERFVEPRGV
jgi:hypothetical protein